VLLQLALKANKAIHLLLVMETARAVELGLQLPESAARLSTLQE